MASWIAVMLFAPQNESRERLAVGFTFTGGTDNLANQSLSRKRSSTKTPLMFVLMQLAQTLSDLNLITVAVATTW
jgi:hypothetical protein